MRRPLQPRIEHGDGAGSDGISTDERPVNAAGTGEPGIHLCVSGDDLTAGVQLGGGDIELRKRERVRLTVYAGLGQPGDQPFRGGLVARATSAVGAERVELPDPLHQRAAVQIGREHSGHHRLPGSSACALAYRAGRLGAGQG